MQTLLGELHRPLGEHGGHAEHERRRQHGALETPAHGVAGNAAALAAQQPACHVRRGQRVERPGHGAGRQARPVDLPQPVVVDGEEDVDGFRVLDEERLFLARQPADDPLAFGGAGDHAGCQMGPDQRTGNEGSAELLEDEGGLRCSQSGAAVRFRQPQRENACVGQLPP